MTPTNETPRDEDETSPLDIVDLTNLEEPIGDAARAFLAEPRSASNVDLFDGKLRVFYGRPKANRSAKPRRIYPTPDRRGVTLLERRAAPQKAWETWELDVIRDFAHRRGWITWEPNPGGFDITPGVVGKEYRVERALLSKIDAVARKAEVVAEIISGFRSYASQLRLWLLFLAGRGNPANPPGTSNHEARRGKPATAADVYIRGVAFWTYVKARPQLAAYARRIGLTQPHSNEPWHVEHK